MQGAKPSAPMVFTQSSSNIPFKHNIKTLCYQYTNSHNKDKTVLWLSHLYIGNLDTQKNHLNIEMGPRNVTSKTSVWSKHLPLKEAINYSCLRHADWDFQRTLSPQLTSASFIIHKRFPSKQRWQHCMGSQWSMSAMWAGWRPVMIHAQKPLTGRHVMATGCEIWLET